MKSVIEESLSFFIIKFLVYQMAADLDSDESVFKESGSAAMIVTNSKRQI
jgi:hypothetical protein